MSVKGRVRSGTSGLRTALLVALVLVVALTGLPVLMGAGPMDPCPECGPVTLPCSVACAMVPAALTSVAVALVGFVVAWPRRRYGLMFAWSIDPPPRRA